MPSADPRSAFWERPEIVELFAGRPPDARMRALLTDAPRATRVLDLGCAGGRNTVWLAERGLDVYGIDASRAMVAKTRGRLAEHQGSEAAAHRVRLGRMDDLRAFADATFDVVLAFGILQGAQRVSEWHAAAAEVARVLRPGGHLLVAHFSPASDPTGEGVHPVKGERHVYTGFSAQRHMILLDPDLLDAWMSRHGLRPVAPSTTVRVTSDAGYRTTVNGHFRKIHRHATTEPGHTNRSSAWSDELEGG